MNIPEFLLMYFAITLLLSIIPVDCDDDGKYKTFAALVISLIINCFILLIKKKV